MEPRHRKVGYPGIRGTTTIDPCGGQGTLLLARRGEDSGRIICAGNARNGLQKHTNQKLLDMRSPGRFTKRVPLLLMLMPAVATVPATRESDLPQKT